MRILAIQHEPGTGSLRFGDWLIRAGAQFTVLRPDLGEQVPDATSFTQVADALMVLGGAADADDDDHHPWFRPVRKLLTTSAKGVFPSFDICLGGQMLTLATGGGIRRRAVDPDWCVRVASH